MAIDDAVRWCLVCDEDPRGTTVAGAVKALTLAQRDDPDEFRAKARTILLRLVAAVGSPVEQMSAAQAQCAPPAVRPTKHASHTLEWLEIQRKRGAVSAEMEDLALRAIRDINAVHERLGTLS